MGVALCESRVVVFYFFILLLGRGSVTHTGEWRKLFYPGPGTTLEPGGGQWWPYNAID